MKDSVKRTLFEKAIRELAESEDPTLLGTFKTGGRIRCYSYRVNKSFRLLYSVDYDAHAIKLLAAGDHKVAYGND